MIRAVFPRESAFHADDENVQGKEDCDAEGQLSHSARVQGERQAGKGRRLAPDGNQCKVSNLDGGDLQNYRSEE